jgi:hypothetical protein
VVVGEVEKLGFGFMSEIKVGQENIVPENPKRELNPFKGLVRQAERDIQRVFVEEFQVLTEGDVRNVGRDTEFLLPGQALIKKFQSAGNITSQTEYIQKTGFNVVEVKAAQIYKGFLYELLTTGFVDEITNKAYIRLAFPLIVLLPTIAANPIAIPISASFFEILHLLQIPNAVYHEMLHRVGTSDFSQLFGFRFDESFTDYWIRETTRKGKGAISSYVRSYSTFPPTALFNLPFATFDRPQMECLVENMTMKTGDRNEALKLLASGYCGKGTNPDLIQTFDRFTKGRGREVIVVMNSGGSGKRRNANINTLFNC